MQRRSLLAATATIGVPAVISGAFAAESGVTDQEIVLGQSIGMTGPAGTAVSDFNAGAKLYIDELNARGGISGRRLRLVTLNDELDPTKAVANCKALLTEHKILAFFGAAGTGTVAASTPIFRESNAPLIGNYAVGDAVRDKAAGAAYFVRATYGREVGKIVRHLSTIGITKIAVATLDIPGGVEVLSKVRKAVLEEGKAKDVVASAAMKIDGSNIIDVGKALAAAKPQAVIVFLPGSGTVAELMTTMWGAGEFPAFYCMSTVAGDQVAKLLGSRLRGLASSQVVPYPWSDVDTTARGFQTLADARRIRLNYLSYEGYINAMVLAEGLKRAGRDLRRTTLHSAMRSMRTRLGGLDLDFSTGNPTGSNFVDLVVVTSDGRFRR
jgi:branched-chain amino acid transport system substrate-binding protein